MKNKKGDVLFFGLHAVKFVLGAIVVVILLAVVWNFFGPQDVAEASTKKVFDDIIVKVRQLGENEEVIAYGYVDKGAKILGFNSEQTELDGVIRPKQCGALSNSCICAVKEENVLGCKGFTSSDIKNVVATKGTSTKEISQSGNYAGKSGNSYSIVDGYYLIVEGERDITLKFTLRVTEGDGILYAQRLS